MTDKQVVLGPQEADRAAEVLKALAHPLRLRIASVLSGGPMHVSGLAERLGVVPAVVSQQLRVLRSANLVAPQTEDGHAWYRIIEPHLYQMLSCMSSCLASRKPRGDA